jgi:ribosomal-protein-alanine N-acetyltransferase
MQKKELNNRFLEKKQIETARLILRRICRTDAEDMFAYASLPCVTRYLTWQEHPDILHTKRYLAYLQTRYHAGEFYDWALVEKKQNKMIGTCGFTRFDTDNNFAEIGYVINPAYRGNGYACEALERVLKFGFEVLELNRIEAKYIVGNDASRRVMEKCGMKFEGVARQSMLIKGKYRDIGKYAILKSEFADSGNAD